LTGEVKKFRDLNELSEVAARDIADIIAGTVSRKGHFSLALSGGSTPRTLHNLMATVYRETIPWESVSIFFGDERYVPDTDRQSNYLMARETLLNLIPIPIRNIHPIPTDRSDPAKAAEAYETELRNYFPENGSSFDLVLLGMGKEGHTASLFPHSPALDEKHRWVMSVDVPAIPHQRITLTYPILNHASAVYFLVSGSDKRGALREVLGQGSDLRTFPAKGVNPVRGKLEWWVDSAALTG
jgi:6-phosphogluconolactonase